MRPILPIVQPRHPTATQLLPHLQQILSSGTVTNNGPYVQKFEAALTKRLGIPTIVFSSGTAALVAMLRAVDVAGGYVICPSFTFPATPNAIALAGAQPLFADIDPETLTLGHMSTLVRHPVKAVLGVDPYGLCWTPPAIDVPVLIDAAPAFGSTIDGRPPVDRGDAMVFSFHATKPFSTMEGGALCTHDTDLLDRAMMIRNFGQGKHGDCSVVGFNGKMMEICALVGLKQLEAWDHRVRHRRESVCRLRAALDGIKGLRVAQDPPGQEPIWTYLPIFIEPEFGWSRDQVFVSLADAGVQTRIYYHACHKLSVYDTGQILPITEWAAAHVISLPVYDEMGPVEIDVIANVLREFRR